MGKIVFFFLFLLLIMLSILNSIQRKVQNELDLEFFKKEKILTKVEATKKIIINNSFLRSPEDVQASILKILKEDLLEESVGQELVKEETLAGNLVEFDEVVNRDFYGWLSLPYLAIVFLVTFIMSALITLMTTDSFKEMWVLWFLLSIVLLSVNQGVEPKKYIKIYRDGRNPGTINYEIKTYPQGPKVWQMSVEQLLK